MVAKYDDIGTELSWLADDLNTGAWALRYRDLLEFDTYDAGYRIVIAGHPEQP